jgi:hypothetical protein
MAKKSLRTKLLRASMLSLVLPLSLLVSRPALASDPLPGDGVVPPPNVNILLVYNEFEDAGTLGAVHGSSYNDDTHISTDVTVLRYVHTFVIDGVNAGVQAYVPYVGFLGEQRVGVASIGPLVAGGPNVGAGKANLNANSGFGQPNVGAFVFPLADGLVGNNLALGFWIAPPIGDFNASDSLNPGQDVWVYEAEVGFRHTLFGTISTNNLTLELWGEAYGFGTNDKSADVSPSVSANNLGVYSLFGVTNPLTRNSAIAATFHEQPSFEFRAYLPYVINPATNFFVSPGLYQSFGGKQTYSLGNGTSVDSGNRTQETQLRFFASSFVTPSTAIMLEGVYDVANHGGPINRGVQLRVAKFF